MQAQSLTQLILAGETDIEIAGTEIIYSSLTLGPGARISGTRNGIGQPTAQIIIKRGGMLNITPPFEMRDLTIHVEADVRASSVISVTAPQEVDPGAFFAFYLENGALSPMGPTAPYLVHWNIATQYRVSFHNVNIYSAPPWGEMDVGAVAFIGAFGVRQPVCFTFYNCTYSGKSIFLFLGHPGLSINNNWMPSTVYMRRCNLCWTPGPSEPIDPNAIVACYKPCHFLAEECRLESIDPQEPDERQAYTTNLRFSTAEALAALPDPNETGHMATNLQLVKSALSNRAAYADQPNAHVWLEESALGCVLDSFLDNPNAFAVHSLLGMPGYVDLQPSVPGGEFLLVRNFEFGSAGE